MSKTAMQELIHDFKHGKFNGLTNTQIDKLLEKYLKKEKEQIASAYQQGVTDEYGDSIDFSNDTQAEDYYNQTYGGNK